MKDLLRSLGTAAVAYGVVAAAVVSGWMLYEPVRVTGASMSPALEAGDVVLVRRGAVAVEGDIALVREPGRQAVLHRIVRVSPSGSLRLKGDANAVMDFSDVAASSVAGPVVRVIPIGTLLARWRAE